MNARTLPALAARRLLQLLLKAFHSVKRMREATEQDLAGVIGPQKAALMHEYFHAKHDGEAEG